MNRMRKAFAQIISEKRAKAKWNLFGPKRLTKRLTKFQVRRCLAEKGVLQCQIFQSR